MPRKAMSKIGDPAPIVLGQVTYQSHANYVEAVASESMKVIWHTELYSSIAPKGYDPNLEEDAQWNIISTIKVVGDDIEARDGKGRTFRVNAKTGRIQLFEINGSRVTANEYAKVRAPLKPFRDQGHNELEGKGFNILRTKAQAPDGAIYLVEEETTATGEEIHRLIPITLK